MPRRKDPPPAPPVDPFKRQTFFTIVQAAILASERGKHPQKVALDMTLSIEASEAIPVELSASGAANEFVEHLFRSLKDQDDSNPPPAWMGLLSKAEFEAMSGVTEILVDGKWIPENPRWIGLPGDTTHGFEVLAHLREGAKSTFDDLMKAVRGINRKTLGMILSDAETEGLVERHTVKGSPVWERTFKLLNTKPSAEEIEKAYSAIDKAAARGELEEFEEAETLGIPSIDRDKLKPYRRRDLERDAGVLLEELSDGELKNSRELGRHLPHLDRDGVFRCLKFLRSTGRIEMIGKRRGVKWRLVSRHSKSAKRSEYIPETAKTAGADQKAKGEAKRSARPSAPFRFLSEEEKAQVERFVTQNPGCRIGEIAEGLKWENSNRLKNLAIKMHGERRLYKRQGRHYPGKDPDWER